MPAFLVTYDLNKPGQNYDGLIEELKKTAGWWHYMKSTWILSTSETPAQFGSGSSLRSTPAIHY
jgi:hypothetical protein